MRKYEGEIEPRAFSLKFTILFFFLHIPSGGLNEILDPTKTTSARPRKLGLRPQTVRVRPSGRFLRPSRVPQNFIGPLQGTCGVGVNQKPSRPIVVPFRHEMGKYTYPAKLPIQLGEDPFKFLFPSHVIPLPFTLLARSERPG